MVAPDAGSVQTSDHSDLAIAESRPNRKAAEDESPEERAAASAESRDAWAAASFECTCRGVICGYLSRIARSNFAAHPSRQRNGSYSPARSPFVGWSSNVATTASSRSV